MLEGLFIVLLVAAALIAGGIWLLVAFTSTVIHVVGIAVLVIAVFWLWDRLVRNRRRGAGVPPGAI